MASTTLLFDLDGTITDSGPGIMRSVEHALRQMRFEPLDPTRLRGFVGPPLHDSFASLGLGPTDVDTAVEHFRDYFRDRGIFENVVYTGMDAALGRLRSAGHPMAVATSKPTVFAERIVARFDLVDHFSCVVGSELDGSRREKSAVIEAVLHELGCVDGEPLLMVGDRLHDVRGAAAHRIASIGVSWGYADVGELESSAARCVVDDPDELVAAVRDFEEEWQTRQRTTGPGQAVPSHGVPR